MTPDTKRTHDPNNCLKLDCDHVGPPGASQRTLTLTFPEKEGYAVCEVLKTWLRSGVAEDNDAAEVIESFRNRLRDLINSRGTLHA